ncbi:MAG: bifunctional methionine sulfoxide reductase B/A protein [Sphaerochaeta sp.]|nr:bifunctional methionine sulfoxide reductase B/A protein [Spirochaetales bacterium]
MSKYLLLALLGIVVIISLAALVRGQRLPAKEAVMQTQHESRFTYIPINTTLLNPLNRAEEAVIIHKGTERPFTGEYTDLEEEGTYYCRHCDAPLYSSASKFHSNCGWPSFDDELEGAVTRVPDADGMRTEIICATCGGHLGHVFEGERFTEKNTRHCVNSISLVFREGPPVAKAVFAGGCFWGLEHLFALKTGVYSAVSGYTGGTMERPTYEDVLGGKTGHLEAVEVLYNPQVISYEELARYFFEIHDPTQTNGQGPDIGSQYLSAIFYRSKAEFDTAVRLIDLLEKKGYKVATTLRPLAPFWEAEEYHQDYYRIRGTLPYCHTYTKRF